MRIIKQKVQFFPGACHHGFALTFVRLLIHKLRQSEIDGFTVVFGEGMEKWTPLSEVPELKEAAQKIAEEERKTQLVLNSSEDSQIYIEDRFKELNDSIKPSKDANDKKRFVADDGIKYMWDDDLQDWVEDDADSESDKSEEDDDEAVEDNGAEGDPGKKLISSSNEVSEKKRKRKKKKKDSSEWKDSVGSKYWIYIQNLPLDITVDELKAHFSKVGFSCIYTPLYASRSD